MIEDGMYSYLLTQSNITDIVGDRIYPTTLPQQSALPAVAFSSESEPLTMLTGKPVLDRTYFQFDCYARTSREAKLLAAALRVALESYVGAMGSHTVRKVTVLRSGTDDFDDVPNDFRVISEYEVWHTV